MGRAISEEAGVSSLPNGHEQERHRGALASESMATVGGACCRFIQRGAKRYASIPLELTWFSLEDWRGQL